MTGATETPLVSIITPVYNGAKYLDELIRSVLEQDYPCIEHIVIDDGSTDNGATVAVLAKYPHLRWWTRENRGQYPTLNEGLAAAKGSVVGIISADDKYVVPSTLSDAVAFLQNHSDIASVYGRTLRMDSDGHLLPFDPTLRREPFPAWFLRHALLLQHCSLFVSASLIRQHELWFDQSFKYAGDWDWIIRISIAGKMGYLDRPMSLYREHPAQTRETAGRHQLSSEDRRILRRYNSNIALYRLLIYEHRLRKAAWIVRKRGLRGLFKAAQQWLGRSR